MINPESSREELHQESPYVLAKELYFNQNYTSNEVKDALLKKNVEEVLADEIVSNLEKEFRAMRSEEANKKMVYGILFCAGGIIATAANVGYIFWGAIVFGAIQFFKGLTMK